MSTEYSFFLYCVGRTFVESPRTPLLTTVISLVWLLELATPPKFCEERFKSEPLVIIYK